MAEPADPDLPAPVGTIIAGRYELVRLLGAGAMGAVYQAKQLSMDRLVAVKVMHRHVAAMPGLAPRFHREMKATSRIEHANTVRVFDFGADEGGQLFLAMEFLDGRPLSKLLAEAGRLPLARLVHIATQIARALGAAHAEGITHRDLKPDNVMLLDRYGEQDLVKVVDFGIARFTDDESATKMTADGALIGTPAYMSPEQAMGKPVDGRSDFYSLGVMLYEMATGQPPFSAPTLAGILVAHATETPPPPSSIAPVAPTLEALILQLMAKDPGERPQTAADVVRLLSACGEPAAATEPMRPVATAAVAAESSPSSSQAAVAGEGQGAPRRTATAAAIVGVATVAGVIAAVLIARHPATTAPPAPLPPSNPAASAAPPASDARQRLDALWLADGDPLPPAHCRAAGATRLDKLARAAAQLQGSIVGAPRPQDRDAFLLLKDLEPDAAGAAEYWALASRARNTVEDSGAGALAAADRARRLCPDFALAHNLAGNALQRDHDSDGAAAAYRQALALAPEFIAPRYNLGLLALRNKDAAGAIAAFDAVLAKDPQHPRAHFARGEAHLILHQLPQALDDLEQATLRHPDDALAWRALATAREQSGAHKTAREAWCQAKKLGDTEAAKLCP